MQDTENPKINYITQFDTMFSSEEILKEISRYLSGKDIKELPVLSKKVDAIKEIFDPAPDNVVIEKGGIKATWECFPLISVDSEESETVVFQEICEHIEMYRAFTELGNDDYSVNLHYIEESECHTSYNEFIRALFQQMSIADPATIDADDQDTVILGVRQYWESEISEQEMNRMAEEIGKLIPLRKTKSERDPNSVWRRMTHYFAEPVLAHTAISLLMFDVFTKILGEELYIVVKEAGSDQEREYTRNNDDCEIVRDTQFRSPQH